MKYVIYFRVSTKKQGESGLGLEAQKRDVNLFLENYAKDYEILGEYTDVESGTKDNRKGFTTALELAKKQGAELLVAKLDRISRKVSTIALTMEEVKIRVACMPAADNFQLHLYAALAEQEKEFISQRTKAALKEAKANGVKLGGANPKWQEKNRAGLMVRNKRQSTKAKAFAEQYRQRIELMVGEGWSLDKIATKMKALNLKTSRDCYYTAGSISSLIKHLEIVR